MVRAIRARVRAIRVRAIRVNPNPYFSGGGGGVINRKVQNKTLPLIDTSNAAHRNAEEQ